MSKYVFIHAIEDGKFNTYSREFFRKPQLCTSVPLDEIHYIGWYVSPFSRKDTVRLMFCSEDPGRVKTVEEFDHQLALDLNVLLRVPDLIAQPAVHEEFVRLMQPRIDSGDVVSQVDLVTLMPLSQDSYQLTL